MTTPSTLSSASGSAIASPATFGTSREAPARSIPWEKSHAIACTPPAASSTVETAVPAATSSTVDPARAPRASRVARRQPASSPPESTVLVRSYRPATRSNIAATSAGRLSRPAHIPAVSGRPPVATTATLPAGLLPWSGDHASHLLRSGHHHAPRPPPHAPAHSAPRRGGARLGAARR